MRSACACPKANVACYCCLHGFNCTTRQKTWLVIRLPIWGARLVTWKDGQATSAFSARHGIESQSRDLQCAGLVHAPSHPRQHDANNKIPWFPENVYACRCAQARACARLQVVYNISCASAFACASICSKGCVNIGNFRIKNRFGHRIEYDGCTAVHVNPIRVMSVHLQYSI